MQYVNPYLLLGIEPGTLFDNPASIRSAKKRVLAEIAFENYITVNGVEVSRSDALRVIEELDDEDIRGIHARVFAYKEFSKFLSNGEGHCFNLNGRAERFGETYDEGFVSLLSPFYAYQFNKALTGAIKSGRSEKVATMVADPFPLPPQWRDKAYQGARQYLGHVHEHLVELNQGLKDSNKVSSLFPEGVEKTRVWQRFHNPFWVQATVEPVDLFLDFLLSRESIEVLNNLPEEFQLLRDEITNALHSIAVDLNNNHDEHRLALQIAERTILIDSGSTTYDRVTKNRDIIRTIVNRENLEILRSQFEDLSNEIKQHKLKGSAEAVRILYKIFDVDRINELSSTALNNSIIGLTKQLSEIAWRLVTSYHSTADALAILARGLQIRLSDPKVSEKLLRSLTDVYGEIESFKDQLSLEGGSSPNPTRQTAPKFGSTTFGTNTSSTGQRRSGTTGRSDTQKATVASRAGSVFEQDLTIGLIADDGILRSFIRYFRDGTAEQRLTVAGGIILVVFLFTLPIIFITGLSGAAKVGSTTAERSPTPYVNSSANSGTVPDIAKNVVPPPGSPSVRTASPSPSPSPTATPTPRVERPTTGSVMSRGSRRGGLGQLFISNGTGDDAIAKLIDNSTGKSYREVYVRAHSSIKVSGIAPGDYELLFSTGQNYAPSLNKFLSNASYSKFDDHFLYHETRESGGTRYRSYEVSLNKVAYGTATTSTIDESSFSR